MVGECDRVMLHVDNFVSGTPLDIHIRTKIRYEYCKFVPLLLGIRSRHCRQLILSPPPTITAYIESAALRIGHDDSDVLEVTSWGGYSLGGIGKATVDGKIPSITGYPIHYSRPNDKVHVFDVVIGPNETITLSTFKDLVSVKINGGTPDHFKDSVGVMGSFEGELLARDGVTVIADRNAFGQEWQIREGEAMLFQTVREPQAPKEQCRLPTAATEMARHRRLGESIARTAAEKACAHLSGKSKEACVFDVMAVGDVDIARAGSY